MQRNDFHYELPAGLVATHPAGTRSSSRLLCLDPVADALADRQFADIPELLEPGDLLVFNDTRVIPARLFGTKSTGGRVEVLVERITGANTALAHVRASKSPRAGTRLQLEGNVCARISGREGELYRIEFPGNRTVLELLESAGHMPLPPYIGRADEQEDRQRYRPSMPVYPVPSRRPPPGCTSITR